MHTFCNTREEVLMAELSGSFTKCDHSSFHTHCLALGSVKLVCTPRQLLVVDIRAASHLSRVDLEDTRSGGFVREGELNLSVQTTRSKQGGIKNIDTISSSDDLAVMKLVSSQVISM